MTHEEQIAKLTEMLEIQQKLHETAIDMLKPAIEIAVQKEREACAKLCAEDGVQAMDFTGGTFVGGYFAKRIMDRGDI